MIILDTHIWLWWNQDTPQITKQQKEIIDNYRLEGIGISAISLIEISRLVERGRLILPKSLKEWFSIALAENGVLLIPITPAIAIEAYSLPDEFHNILTHREDMEAFQIYIDRSKSEGKMISLDI